MKRNRIAMVKELLPAAQVVYFEKILRNKNNKVYPLSKLLVEEKIMGVWVKSLHKKASSRKKCWIFKIE